MVEATISAGSGEKKFATFLINYIVETNPGDLQTNLAKLVKHMTENLPPKSEENLYRKQYGNLEQCVKDGQALRAVFRIDGSTFKFHEPEAVEAAIQAGALNEDAVAKYREGRESFLTKHLTLWKNNGMNKCKKCGTVYHVKGNKADSCRFGGYYEPRYDFEKDPDNVLNCEI